MPVHVKTTTVTSLDEKQASSAEVVLHYWMLENVERPFRVMKDFLGLRPVFHRLEDRVRGQVSLCVVAAVIEAVMGHDLENAEVKGPDLPEQTMTPRRALVELGRIRQHHLDVEGRQIDLIDRPSALQAKILSAFGVDTSTWSKATIA